MKHGIAMATLAALGLTAATPAAAADETCEKNKTFALILHGGFMGSEDGTEPRHYTLMRELVERGRANLERGAAAVDVVVEAIAAMEDSGIMDAGKGSIVNTAGFTETDASLMEGHTGRSGAVAAMQRLKNPIRAARLVMDRTPHVLFAGTTGEQTLIGLGAESVEDPNSYFQEYVPPAKGAAEPAREHDTVGAVALDRCGNLAAGTSTGGWPGKMPGRVGDSPIIGASTFANERYALSATGRGEYFINRGATQDIAARAEYQEMSLQTAADYVVKNLIGERDGAAGAIIALSREGDIVLSSNGFGVRYGYASDSRSVTVGGKLGQ
jgi:isoaspartyl peptidase/L-asparaginase-like protein (Ntn-hydrolase superfamily)